MVVALFVTVLGIGLATMAVVLRRRVPGTGLPDDDRGRSWFRGHGRGSHWSNWGDWGGGFGCGGGGGGCCGGGCGGGGCGSC